jgi:hypothetical protein
LVTAPGIAFRADRQLRDTVPAERPVTSLADRC